MGDPKFTKGPWKVADKVLFGVRTICIRAEGYPWLVAKVADTTNELMLKAAKQDMDWNVFAANAYLMAAAPEMAQCLLDILGEIECDEIPIKDRPASFKNVVEVLGKAGINVLRK